MGGGAERDDGVQVSTTNKKLELSSVARNSGISKERGVFLRVLFVG